MSSAINIKKSIIKNAVKNSTSYRGAAKIVGINNQVMKRLVISYNISTSHFTFGKKYLYHLGKTYNNLTIKKVYRKEPPTNKKYRWYCVCDCSCGTKNIHYRLDGVTTGHVLSCGCRNRNRISMIGSGNPSFNGVGEIGTAVMLHIKRNADKRKLPYTLSKKYLWNLFKRQKGLCQLSGIPLYFGKVRSSEITASLDRIDSTKGYIRGNVQWVHKDINKIKQNFDDEYFIALCKKVANRN